MDSEARSQIGAGTERASGAAVAGVLLDAAQRAVLDSRPDESLSVVGAPGSGKTTTLVELLAHRIREHAFATDEVLALTTDRRAAAELRDLLAARLDRATPGSLARTPQAVAFEIVRDDRARRGFDPPALLTGADEDAQLAFLLDPAGEPARAADAGAGWPAEIGPETRALRGFRQEMRELLAAMSEHDVPPERLAELAELPGAPAAWRGAARFAATHLDLLERQRPNAFTAPGLLLEAASVLYARLDGGERGGAFDRVRLVVVDDAQELTESQRRFLLALEAAGAAVVSFGDPDVSTAAFRGGRPELAVNWRGEGLPAPRRIVLDRVRRGDEALRGVVASVVSRVGARGETRHRAAEARPASGPSGREPADAAGEAASAAPIASASAAGPSAAGPSVVVATADSGVHEARLIAARLRELHLLHGIAWSDMAVVVRRGGAVAGLRRLLARDEVPTSARRAVAAADDASVSAIIALAHVVAGRAPLTGDVIARVLASPLYGVDELRLRRVRRALRLADAELGGRRRGDELLADLVAALGELPLDAGRGPAHAHDAERSELGRIEAVIARFRESGALGRQFALRRIEHLARTLGEMMAASSQGAAADEILWVAWERAGVAEQWRERALGTGVEAERAGERLDAVVALFDAGKRFVERHPDAPLGIFLDEWAKSDVAPDSLGVQAHLDAVAVLSPAAAVGRSFRVVVVAGVCEGVWPNLRIRDTLLGAGRIDAFAREIVETPSIVDRRREVLHDELRLFALAVSRATEHLIVTAVAGEEAAPSEFLRLVEPVVAAAEEPEGAENAADAGAAGDAVAEAPSTGGAGSLEAPTLRSLTARIRHDAAVNGAAEHHVEALARLARAGVPGAHPREWQGLRAPSTEAPLVDLHDPAQAVGVSPSAIERFEQCALDWFVSRHGGDVTGEPAAVGTIVHASGEYAFPDLESRREYARRRLSELAFDSPWRERVVRANVDRMVGALSAYFHRRALEGAELVGVERAFALDLEFDERLGYRATVRLRGKIDRIERNAQGTLDVVDFKTGRTPASAEAAKENAQLTSYQAALKRGGFAPVAGGGEADGSGEAPGGAPGREADAAEAVDVVHGLDPADFRESPATGSAASTTIDAGDPLALRSIDPGGEIPAPAEVGRAVLVYLAKPMARQEWTDRSQEALGDEEVDAFLERVREIALGMAGVREGDGTGEPGAARPAGYGASVESHCLASFGTAPACRIHVIPEVTE